jgi:ATP-binding cassette subfamily F protein uup
MTPIFYIRGGELGFADKIILSDLDLYIYPGDKICLVGKNGCGKSSLIKLIIGEYELDHGDLFRDPNVNIAYLKQDMKIIPAITIYELVLKSFKDKEASKYHADVILEKLKIDGNLKLKNCSGGQIRRAFLAAALVLKPEILLLDEPTNHLDILAIEWLEGYVANYQGAIICISHDRKFQENVTNKVWWIDRGILRKSNRGFKHYDSWQQEIISEEESVLRKLNRKLEVEKGWLNTGVTARRKRNQKRLANLYHLRETLRTHENKLMQAKAKLQFDLAQESKKTKFIIEAEEISFSYENKTIISNFSINVKKGEKIGVIGPNGSGKSTLIKILINELIPETGKITHGTDLDITYFDQHRTQLDPNHSIKLTLCPGGGDQIFIQNRYLHVSAYLKKFMFDPKLQNDKVSTLSGGEANRLLLAKALINPGNLLILDEPTNDLDIDSLEMLLEILADYDGTLFVVSHDRDFLERLVTRSLVFTGDKIIDLYGGYEDYMKFSRNENKQIEKGGKIKSLPVIPVAQNASKLSYKYQRMLEVLPTEIEQLEKVIATTELALGAEDLYTNNPKKFSLLSSHLQKFQKELNEKLTLWFEIETMKDDMKS